MPIKSIGLCVTTTLNFNLRNVRIARKNLLECKDFLPHQSRKSNKYHKAIMFADSILASAQEQAIQSGFSRVSVFGKKQLL